jgi:L-fuculose-phosphate aldolase
MTLAEKYPREADVFLSVCHRLYANGYVTSQAGNVAWRIDDGIILITATCAPKADLGRDDLVFIDANGNVLEGASGPTGELPLYLLLFEQRPDIESVIHCHSPHCCALAILDGDNPLGLPLFPEVVLEIGPAPLVPYATPLSEQLAANFMPYLQKYNAFVMENHGVIMITPRGLEWTLGLVEELESAASSILKARAVGTLKTISREQLMEMDRLLDMRGLPRVGAPGVNKSLVDLYYPAGSS